MKIESPLLEKPAEIIEQPLYSEDEREYLKGLRTRMEQAKNIRDMQHDEFDGMDYITYYEANERAANTFIAPKKNKEDTNFQSGTIRQKLFALLSALVNLNLGGDISAYNEDGLKVQALGDAMEDIILKTNELDNDDEGKYLRHYELLKHGTVFVEECWDEKTKKSKKMKKDFDGKIKGASWDEKIEKAFARPARTIIPGINVYLGDITKYDISDQPFIFTVDIKPYEEAKMMFGEWERWDNVPKKLQHFSSTELNILNPDWRLLETKDGYVEILRYQDKWNNEFAVVLNGTLMTPIGLPLPYGFDEYNIAQQNLEPIHSKFAYGKSLVARIRNKVALLDELLRLGVLKTQKSFMPPYLNNSGRILSNRVFMPGKITHGIQAGTLVPLSEKESQGMTNSELAMIKEIQESINAETTSPTFSGQAQPGSTTATEVIELQRQAKMVLGLTVFSVSMLEWKLEWLRLKNILANWFAEDGETVDEARGVLRSRYRKVSVERPVEGEGMGRRIVVPTDQMPTPGDIMQAENILTAEQGQPIRLIFLNPNELNSAKLTWQIVVRPKEKKSSEIEKLLFRAEITDAMLFGPMLNMDYLAERFSSVWNEDPKKLFKSSDQTMQQTMQEQAMASGTQGTPSVSPRVNLPTAEGALGQTIKTGLQTGA